MQHSIILASGSIYRQQLLAKLHIPFQAHASDIDETPYADETAEELVLRLAEQKALALTKQYPEHLIIGSDQVCSIRGMILGKPHTPQRACEQLQLASGQRVRFYTGLCVYDSRQQIKRATVEHFDVEFRQLSSDLIQRYVQLEQPLDCAGSFKCEGSGIVLFKGLYGDDPNTLVGLPLIRLCEYLEYFGVELLAMPSHS